MRVAHLTTVDMSLRFLVLPQLTRVVELGSEAIGISADGPYVDELERLGVRHIALPGATRGVDPLADIRAMVSLWRILREERPDVIHTHTPKPGLYGRVIGRMARVPAVLNTVHGLYATPDDPMVKRAIVYSLEAFAARFSHVELVQSAEDFRLVTERRITRPGRTVFLGNGVDLTRFDPDLTSPEARQSARADLGIDGDQIVIGVVGRLVAEKGFLELFEAVRDLDDRFRLVVVGPHEPDKADSIAADTISAAEADGVVFLGMRDDVDVLYRAMDVFVLPSHREGFPRAAMEAAASGLPLVVTDIRGCREVVDEGVTGLLVPVRNPKALRAALEKVGGDEELRQRMGEAGRSKAMREFDERRIVHQVITSQVRTLREQGHFERFDDGSETSIRLAASADAKIIARIYTSTNRSRAGKARSITRGVRRLSDEPGGLVLVAEDAFGPVAYVLGMRAIGNGAAPAPDPLRRTRSRRQIENSAQGDHVELLSLGVADPFSDIGIDGALAEAFLESTAGQPVRAIVDLGDERTIGVLESVGFAADPSADQKGQMTDLWAQRS